MNPYEIDAAMIAAEAAKVKFLPFIGKVFRGLFLGIFTSIGYVFGSIWFVLVYCAFAVYFGFVKGTHRPETPPRQPSLPQ